jgi:hypothetical protein
MCHLVQSSCMYIVTRGLKETIWSWFESAIPKLDPKVRGQTGAGELAVGVAGDALAPLGSGRVDDGEYGSFAFLGRGARSAPRTGVRGEQGCLWEGTRSRGLAGTILGLPAPADGHRGPGRKIRDLALVHSWSPQRHEGCQEDHGESQTLGDSPRRHKGHQEDHGKTVTQHTVEATLPTFVSFVPSR